MSIIVDTNVWIDHLHREDAALTSQIESSSVLTHPQVIGELACGSIRRRAHVLEAIGRLPGATVISDAEALELIERRSLHGKGLGFADIHLLGSALAGRHLIWSRDRVLRNTALMLGVLWEGS
jgi:predicted nucleic acid-binding protein